MQTLKSLLQKADSEGRDPYIAMLEYRNTPISGLRYAPAQLAMSRLLRSKLPTSRSVLQARVVNAKPDLQERQQRMKRNYDRGATSLKPLTSGDVVRVQRKSGWEPAVVQYTHESPWSYVVRHEGGELRRNRRHLRRTREQLPLFLPELDDPCTGDVTQPSRRAVAQPLLSRREEPLLSRREEPLLSRRVESILSRRKESLLSRRKESLLNRRQESFLCRRQESLLCRRQESLLCRRQESSLSRRQEPSIHPNRPKVTPDTVVW